MAYTMTGNQIDNKYYITLWDENDKIDSILIYAMGEQNAPDLIDTTQINDFLSNNPDVLAVISTYKF